MTMHTQRRLVFGLTLFLLGPAVQAAPVGLGGFSFDSNLFGDSLLESDGGTFSAGNWLNVANADPGNPGYLTGAHFNTGIANIGFSGGPISYTIGYGAGILNGAGDDLGVVVARFSTDSFDMEVSTDGGLNFSSAVTIGSGSAVDSGVDRTYFYGGSGPFNSSLFVHSLDLDLFGIGGGASVNAIRITGTTELDLIRAAGFDRAVGAPEPGTLALLGMGLLGFRRFRRIN